MNPHSLLRYVLSLAAGACCLAPGGAFCATIGLNFCDSTTSSQISDGPADGFATWTDSWLAGSLFANGTNVSLNGGGSVKVSWQSSNGWQAGSAADNEQGLYYKYLDDGTTTGSTGVQVTITGLSAWLSANSHASYQIRCYANNDAANTFRPITIHEGSATGSALDTMTVAALGNGSYPTSGTPGTGPSRGYVDSISTLTADTITLTIPNRAGSVRGTLSAFKITGIGVAGPIDVFNQVGTASFTEAALAAGKTSVFRADTDLATVTGDFSVAATHNIQVIAPTGGFALQLYPLIEFPAATSPAIGLGSFQLRSLPRGVTGQLTIDTSGDPYVLALDVTTVDPVQPLYWNGNVAGGVWDLDSTANWLYDSASSNYLEGDQVVFNDDATGTTDVVLAASVQPGSVTVNNPTKPYTISGSAILGTGGLTKDGAAMLTLTGANNYGATTINNGTLKLGDGTIQPTVNGTYAIDANGTLKVQYNTAAGAQALAWSKFTGAGTLALATGKTFDYGWGQLGMTAAFTGTVRVEAGRVSAGANGAGLGNTATVEVQAGGQLGLWSGGTTTQNLILAGTGYGETGYEGAVRLADGSGTVAGNITLAGPATICGSYGGGTGTVSGGISGPASAALTFGGTYVPPTYSFVLTGTNDYAGDTIAARGILRIDGTNSGTGTLTVNAGATLAGIGSVSGAATINGTVSPGNATVPQGTLTLGATVLNGTLAVKLAGAAANSLTVNGDLTLGTSAGVSFTGTPTAPSYVLATYTGTQTGTFVTAAPAGYHYSYDSTNKLILLAANTGFAAWIGTFGLAAGDQDMGDDPEGDGLANGIEYILGGQPATGMDAAKLPKPALSGGNFTFTFDRVVSSETPDIALFFQYGSDLADWTSVPLDAANPPMVTITRSGDGLSDQIVVSVPAEPNTQPKLFGRLMAAPTAP